MPKYLLNVPENWYRRYIIEAESEDLVIDIYKRWEMGLLRNNEVKQLGEPSFIDDGPTDSFILEGEYEDS
jgi:hypothetical protein